RDFDKLGAAINTMTRDIARHRNSLESLQQILQSIIDPLVVADPQGLIKQVNHATLELLSCEEKSLLGRPLADLFPEPPTLLTKASFSSALLRKRVTNLETFVRSCQGKRIAVLFSSSPVPGKNIEMGVVGIIKNIDELMTARLAREHALREAEEAHRRIDALLRSVADGLIVTDLSGKVLLHNQPAEQLLGTPGQPLFCSLLKALPDPTLSDTLPPFDITLPAKAGAPHRILQIHSSPVLDHRGSQTGMVSVLRDVTRERALEQIKSEFISTAAHELNSPLTSILGYSELLLDRELSDRFSEEQKRDFLEEILNRSESLSKIVDDLLNISRIESGKPIPLNLQPAALEPLIRKTVDGYQLTGKGHKFDVRLPQPDQRQVLVDLFRIQQVLENLLSNAVKYSPETGTIRIEGSFEPNFYKIQITDQGIGMTEEQLERIFDKFYRCDSSNTAVGGLGLGMSIVRQIVDGHQGRINVTSALGKGTCVTLRLPLADSEESAAAEQHRRTTS
ncbi:MAG: PAS domain S-box protein, partial [Deltaproteobacteria bacterium]|nr:PAS domain S-box protein [Deltaproteobacteria bacterium]